MKLSLRKANTIQSEINEVLKTVSTVATINLDEYQDPELVIANSQSQFTQNVERKLALLAVLENIRLQVGELNHTSGINARLTKIANFEKQIQLFSGFVTQQTRETNEVIVGKLNKIKSSTTDSYYRSDTVSTTIFDKEQLDGFQKTLAGLKKQKQKLQDEVLELNIRTEIELSSADVAVLESENIL